ncbi:MAG: ATP-dependent helicase, partial [bacterium]
FEKLNEDQLRAVKADQGPTLVLAGPGTGKTTVITYRTIYLLQKLKINPCRLIILTFTNKAAEEMQKRIKKYTKLNLPYIGTFHSVIIKLLKEIAPVKTSQYYIGNKINILDEEDKIEIIKHILSIYKTKISPLIIANIISTIKNHKPIQIKEETQKIIEYYNHFIRKSNLLDFDDILLCINNIFTENRKIKEKIRSKFDFVIVDEYQDINVTQFEFLIHLTEDKGNIFVVGDDDQSIYGFRNSEVRIMLDFPKYFPQARIINLTYNYRSAQKILNTYTKLIKYNSKRFDKNLKAVSKQEGLVNIKIFTSEEAEYNYVSQKIMEIKKNYPYKLIAILVRTNEIGKEFEKNLISKGINVKFLGGYDFFERKEIKDILAFLRFINNPKDSLNFTRILKSFFNIKNKQLKKILQELEENEPLTVIENYDYTIYQQIQNLIQFALQNNLLDILQEVSSLYNKSDNQIIKSFLNFCEKVSINYDIKDLDSFLNYITLIRTSRENRIEDSNKVWIMTMHTSKGLEFDIVFIVRVKQGVIPHHRVSEEEKEEERRLMYVAMSRAKEELYITSTVPPSEFIINIS